ncbi:MAG: HlyC/CorC family transporter [Gammaproteobacteria bacterium]|nr:HlyC/CorC family transporter [Gammaproteobacteria bacterium]
MDITDVLLISSLFLLVLVSAFFSGSETGMMSINRYRLRHLARKGNRRAKRVARLLERPDRLLGIILIGNTFANILASAIFTVVMAHLFGDLGVLLATIILTLVILIFAETAPKTYAALRPMKVALPASLPLKILLKILYPLVAFINLMANGLLRCFNIRIAKQNTEALSAEELRTVVHEATGKIPTRYQQMLLRILDLESVTVEDVMVPRNEIYGIDLNAEWDIILQVLINCDHAFVPMYHDDIDKVQGMLNLRKVLSAMRKHELSKQDLLSLADKVYFVPEGALLNRQLLNFQEQQRSVGLVVDEYGDIQGLVTLQDVLEEIVGEFAEGADDVTRLVQKQRDGSVLVDGRANVRELKREIKWQLPVDGPKTLSGLIIEHLEMIPRPGIGCRIEGYPMEIIEVKANIIRSVKIFPKLFQVKADEGE